MTEIETEENQQNGSNGHDAAVRPSSEVFVAMPVLPQSGEVYVGPGAKKEAQSLGLGLTKLSSRQKDDLAAAKRYAMDVSIKQIIIRQQKSQQENQQKQVMYAQALSLMARVYVGSVSMEVREENIKKAFEVFGPIKSINMSYDGTTGAHKGFAFIEFEVPEAALLAQDSMNGQLMGGRNLKVSQVARTANMSQAQPIIEMLQNDAKKYYRVYISNLHQGLSETDLKTVFEAFGEIIKCQLARQTSYGNGNHRGFGYIEFNNRNSMQEAIAGMNMFDLGGQLLRVGRCITPPEALQYLQPSSAQVMPAAAAAAAAAITAKVMAAQATGGAKAGSGSPRSPAPAILPKGNSPAPRMAITEGPRTPPPPRVAPPLAQVVAPRLALTAGDPIAPPPPPPSGTRGFGGFSSEAPPPPQNLPPPGMLGGASVPPPGVAMIPPPGIAAVPPPSVIDPLTGAAAPVPPVEKEKEKKKKKKKNRVDERSLDEKFQKLFDEKKNMWEESLVGPASFGTTEDFTKPKEEDDKEEKLEKLAITGNVQSMALAIIGDGQLVATGKPKKEEQEGEKKSTAPKQQWRSNRVKDPKKIQPKLKTASQVAAAHSAGALGDAIRQEATSQEDASLASQEAVQSIRGNDARHLLMVKLMRTNRSSVLILRNMIGPEDIDEFLEDEIREECGKYGKIVDLLIANDEFTKTVKIFVRYTEPPEVDAAITALNGRFFGGRTVKAEIYDQALYDHGDLSG